MVFTGHVHAYERSYPVYKGQVTIVTNRYHPCRSRPHPTHARCSDHLGWRRPRKLCPRITRTKAYHNTYVDVHARESLRSSVCCALAVAKACCSCRQIVLQIDKCAPVYIVIGDGGNEEVWSSPGTLDACRLSPDTLPCSRGRVHEAALLFHGSPVPASSTTWRAQLSTADMRRPLPAHAKTFKSLCALCNLQGPSDYSSPDPAWSAFREASFGHGILDVTSASTAKWFWQRNQDPSNAVTADTVRSCCRGSAASCIPAAQKASSALPRLCAHVLSAYLKAA